MKTRPIVGIAGLVLTLAVMLPAVFLISRGSVSKQLYLAITVAVLGFVVWVIAYAALVDPLLRRGAGALLGTRIEWQGTGSSILWTPVEKKGCLAELTAAFLGYVFITLWLLPYAVALILIWWSQRQ